MNIFIILCLQFDVSQWLDRHRPTHSTCSQLINVIGEALTTCRLGEEVDSKPLPHYEVYRSHLQAMFVYNFPQHYADVMHIIFKGKSFGQAWIMHINIIKCVLLEYSSSFFQICSNRKLIVWNGMYMYIALMKEDWMFFSMSQSRVHWWHFIFIIIISGSFWWFRNG